MDVVMPQLGETVTEGTITRWFKAVGEEVAADEPLFEVSTDKVDSEVPSPGAGVLTEILVEEGDTVEVGARLAVLGDGAGAEATPEATPEATAPEPEPEPTPAPEPAPEPTPEPEPEPAPAAAAPEPEPEPRAPVPPAPAGGGAVTSPIVRRLLAEHDLDAETVRGTGEGGRITRNDVQRAAREQREQGSGTTGPTPAPSPAPATPAAARSAVARGDEVAPFDNIRRLTASHMVASKATSAHVYTSIEVDFHGVERVRAAHREAFRDREGFSLTYLPFVLRAVCDVVDDFPRVNASVDGESLVIHHDVHLGIAVDLDFQGLIAPVVRDADGKRLRLLAREVRDLADRAHSKRLSPDDLVGGTFTITNMGPFGTFQTFAIINQPQVAILATDAIRKRPVVVEGPDGDDAVAIHPVGMLSLTWDHRAFDGAYAASFLHGVREVLEQRDWDAELA